MTNSTTCIRKHAGKTLQCLALALITPMAYAHEFWLVAHDANSALNQPVVFELRIGTGWPGEQTPRFANLVERFSAQDAQGKWAVEGRNGSMSVGHLRTRTPGATLVALRTNPAHIELPAAAFNQYLAEEGLNHVLALRERYGLMQAPARERYSRNAKSIVWVEDRSDGYDQLTGLPLELQPHSDPLNLKPNTPFTLQVRLNQQPLAGAQIKAQLKTDPLNILTAVSDADGRVALMLPKPGLWLFSTLYMEPSSQDGADWESLWSSLTLNIPFTAPNPSP